MSLTITYNGKASTASDLGIQSVMRLRRPIVSGTRERTVYVPGMNGVHYLGQDREPAIHDLRIYFTGGSITQRRSRANAITAWLYTAGALATLQYSDEAYRYSAVAINNATPTEIAHKGWLDFSFYVPGGYKESTTEKTASPNAGIEPVPVQITVTMTADAPDGVKVICGDDFLEFDVSLLTGDVVEIDTGARTAYIDDAYETDIRQHLTLASEWFAVPVGAFTITAAGATVTFAYRERWL